MIVLAGHEGLSSEGSGGLERGLDPLEELDGGLGSLDDDGRVLDQDRVGELSQEEALARAELQGREVPDAIQAHDQAFLELHVLEPFPAQGRGIGDDDLYVEPGAAEAQLARGGQRHATQRLEETRRTNRDHVAPIEGDPIARVAELLHRAGLDLRAAAQELDLKAGRGRVTAGGGEGCCGLGCWVPWRRTWELAGRLAAFLGSARGRSLPVLGVGLGLPFLGPLFLGPLFLGPLFLGLPFLGLPRVALVAGRDAALALAQGLRCLVALGRRTTPLFEGFELGGWIGGRRDLAHEGSALGLERERRVAQGELGLACDGRDLERSADSFPDALEERHSLGEARAASRGRDRDGRAEGLDQGLSAHELHLIPVDLKPGRGLEAQAGAVLADQGRLSSSLRPERVARAEGEQASIGGGDWTKRPLQTSPKEDLAAAGQVPPEAGLGHDLGPELALLAGVEGLLLALDHQVDHLVVGRVGLDRPAPLAEVAQGHGLAAVEDEGELRPGDSGPPALLVELDHGAGPLHDDVARLVQAEVEGARGQDLERRQAGLEAQLALTKTDLLGGAREADLALDADPKLSAGGKESMDDAVLAGPESAASRHELCAAFLLPEAGLAGASRVLTKLSRFRGGLGGLGLLRFLRLSLARGRIDRAPCAQPRAAGDVGHSDGRGLIAYSREGP